MIGILIGITLCALALAAPAILGAIGFSAAGPVAGSIAAGWQASMGSVVAGSLFAFLQSAAMGGAAAGIFAGIGALGAAVTVGCGIGLGSLKEPIAGLAEKAKGAVDGLAENSQKAMGKLQGAASGLAHNFVRLFGKRKDD